MRWRNRDKVWLLKPQEPPPLMALTWQMNLYVLKNKDVLVKKSANLRVKKEEKPQKKPLKQLCKRVLRRLHTHMWLLHVAAVVAVGEVAL